MAIFKRQYSSSIDIDAPSEVVWSVLKDTSSYHRWNTFTTKVDLSWELGKAVVMEVAMKPNRSPITQTEYLTQYVENQKFAWGMKWWPILFAERTQEVTPEGNGCRYETTDTITGPFTPIVHWLYGRQIQDGFDRVCQDLKSHAERVVGS